MTIDRIDWLKLKPYKRDSRESFEHLCYQIAKELYSDQGVFTPIDDSGGGSGIEFFLELPNGDIWGWQVKYYPGPNQRLNANRRAKIQQSLKTTQKHYKTRLKRWYLCTPLDLEPKGTASELDWFRKSLSETAGPARLFHWGDSELTSFLRLPKLNGIFQFFFGKFQPRPEWFKNQVAKELANLGDKYIPALHTATNIDFYLHTLIGSPTFTSEAHTKLNGLRMGCEELKALAKEAGSNPPLEFATELTSSRESVLRFCKILDDEIEKLSIFLSTPGITVPVHTISAAQDELHSLWKSLANHWHPIDEAEGKTLTQESPDKINFRRLNSLKGRLWSRLDGVVPSNLLWFQNYLQIFGRRVLHLLGGAGAGKTHVLAKLCSSIEVSAVFLRGSSFTNVGTIEAQILQQLDLHITWKEFLSALSTYATSYEKRVLLAIDALNEADDILLWTNNLRGFEEELAHYPNISLATSCRPSYREEIWKDAANIPFLNVIGFNSWTVKEAVARYFEYFRIAASTTLVTIEAFKHPLYLSIFCHATNRDRQEVKQVFLGQQSLFTIFEQYLDAANISFSRRIDRPIDEKVLHGLLRKFAKRLWLDNTRGLSRGEARALFDGADHAPWSKSLTKALLDEELILSRSFHEGHETYEFAYDLLGGHLIAEQALTTLPNGFTSLEQADATNAISTLLKPLIDTDFSKRHPLHSDILRAIAAILPARTGKHLLYLTRHRNAFTAGVNALFEMDSKYIKDRETHNVEILFEHKKNREPLIECLQNTAFVPRHPLNASLFSRLLANLSMIERDLCWSEYIRTHESELRGLIHDFVESFRKEILEPEYKNQIRLAAEFVVWVLTSTNRFLRDAATHALVIFGTRFPRALFNLTEFSLFLNDPYVPERMLAAAYGVSMRLHYRLGAERFRTEVLPRFAYRVFMAMFAENASLATTHSLQRDYAKNIILLALLHAPGLLTDSEKQKITPPFRGGIRNWRRRPDIDRDKYREGNSPLGFDWRNDSLGSVVPGRSNHDYKHPGFIEAEERILWRIHDLGYSLDHFGEIDKRIASAQWRPQQATTITDRYGEKYVWIAFYELYGFLDDEGVLRRKEFWELSPHPNHADIDPSFPGRPHKFFVLKDDILQTKQKDTLKWVESGPDPNFASYLASDKVTSHTDEYFLLNATFLRRNDQLLRNGFAFIRAFYVTNRDFADFRKFVHTESPGKWWRYVLDTPRGFFAGEFPWRSDLPISRSEAFKIKIGQYRVRNVRPPVIVVEIDGRRFPQVPMKLPKWHDEPITRTLQIEIPVQDFPFDGRSPIPRADETIPSKEFCLSFGLFLDLPSWDLVDPQGKRVSVTSRVGKFSNSDAATYVLGSLVKQYLRAKDMQLVWVIWGERQRLSGSGGDAGYRQYTQLYWLDGETIKPF